MLECYLVQVLTVGIRWCCDFLRRLIFINRTRVLRLISPLIRVRKLHHTAACSSPSRGGFFFCKNFEFVKFFITHVNECWMLVEAPSVAHICVARNTDQY